MRHTTSTACAPPASCSNHVTQTTYTTKTPHMQTATHHLHCLCATSALHVKLAACPAILDTLSCRHSCVREPSTVVRTLQAAQRELQEVAECANAGCSVYRLDAAVYAGECARLQPLLYCKKTNKT
jgi:hypothetical protein